MLTLPWLALSAWLLYEIALDDSVAAHADAMAIRIVSTEVVTAVFILSVLSMTWAVAAPAWVERIIDTSARRVMWSFLVGLLSLFLIALITWLIN